MSLADKRRRAQEKGAQKRRNRQDAPEPAPPSESHGASPIISDPDPIVAARLQEYLDIVGQPTDWSDARTIEQVRGEIIKSAGNALDLQATRGRLVPRSELDLMAKKIRDSWWREAQQVATATLSDLADLPMDVRTKVKASIEAQVLAAASRVKAEMGA